MEHRILKLALGALALAALGFAGYRFMQNRDNVEIQSTGPCPSGQRLCKGQGVPMTGNPGYGCVNIGTHCADYEG